MRGSLGMDGTPNRTPIENPIESIELKTNRKLIESNWILTIFAIYKSSINEINQILIVQLGSINLLIEQFD